MDKVDDVDVDPSIRSTLSTKSIPFTLSIRGGSLLSYPFMSRKNRERLPTSQPQQPLQNLGAALGKLPEARLEQDPNPPQPAEVPLWKCGRVVLRRETAHRGGKVVVVVDQFASHLPLSFIEKTARQLKHACGVGGTVKGRTIEIQGEQVTNVRTKLIELGFEVAGVR